MVRFNEKTGEYASIDAKGNIKTYMHPQPKDPVTKPNGWKPPEKYANAKEYFYDN